MEGVREQGAAQQQSTGQEWQQGQQQQDQHHGQQQQGSRTDQGAALAGSDAPGLQRRRQQQPTRGAEAAAPAAAAAVPSAPLPPVVGQHPWRLTFVEPRLEAAFAAHYAHSMWRTDLVAVLSHLCFYLVLLLAPGPVGHLAWKVPYHVMLRGMSYVPWSIVLLIPPLRRWYLRHRDACLCILLFNMGVYMMSVKNHQPWVDPAFATHPMFQGGIFWTAFTLLFFQPRVLAHRWMAALLAASQLPVVGHYCGQHFAGGVPWCWFKGVIKVAVVALLPLAGVYWLEGRARRLFLCAPLRPRSSRA